VKTERIQSNSSEPIFVYKKSDLESVQIVYIYEYEIGAYQLRIRGKYGSVADKHFVRSIFINKNRID
jgi:hypothetical protein